MQVRGAYAKCKQYIETHKKLSEQSIQTKIPVEVGPCITISRETGSGSFKLAQHLVDYLESYYKESSMRWTIFDRNLIEKVLEDHQLPNTISDFLTEDKHSFTKSMMDELFGLHPSPRTLVQKTVETILQIAQIGYSIIIGRGGNIATAKLNNTFHVRLVAPLEMRIAHIRKLNNLSVKEAERYIKEQDLARRNYIKKYFHRDVDDPKLYHIVINLGLISHEQAAKIIGDAVLSKSKK
ncbi:MAG: cytidylate kinase-like family protein [Ignavibacteria bacterium]|nr:cytidylate kinase-like family protein [Ignavibacteria bacterium]